MCHCLVGRVFSDSPGDLDSIPGRVVPKTFKMKLDASLLNTQQYKVRIKGKMEQSRERSSPSSTPCCSSYWKRSLLVALDYSRQPYLLSLYISIYIHHYHQGVLWQSMLRQENTPTASLLWDATPLMSVLVMTQNNHMLCLQ